VKETDKAILSVNPSTVGAKLLEVKEAGTYTVRALAEDGCGAVDNQILTVLIFVSDITINSASTVVKGSTLNMSVDIAPLNATNKNINWSVTPGTGNANIDHNGVLTATAVGTIIAKATSASNPNVFATKVITITAPADNNNNNSSDDSSSDNSSSNTASATSSDPFQALSPADRSAIVNKLKEYLPYTLLESKGLTVEILDTLTDHKFTKAYLETLVKDPELIKKSFGIDVKAMIEYLSLEPVEKPSFSDISSHWAKDNIIKAAQQGFVAGLPDGTFVPDQALQAADTLTFLNRVLLKNDMVYNKLPRSTVNKYLKEYKDHWAYASMASVCAKLDEKTVKAIAELGDKPMTRELLAQIVYELTKDQIKPITGQKFSMADINGSPYKNALMFCVGTELLYGTSQTTMSPSKELTRAELMAILTRLDKKLNH
jgi:hypothetical protein